MVENSIYEFLEGDWEGGDEQDPSQGYGRNSFSFDLERNIFVRKNRTVFAATPQRPAFTHDDLLIIYREPAGAMRGIYFDNEQHVIHYEVSVADDQQTLSLTSDAAPSMPQFRFTYLRTGQDTVDARFEIAPPGKPGAFNLYLQGSMKRLRAS